MCDKKTSLFDHLRIYYVTYVTPLDELHGHNIHKRSNFIVTPLSHSISFLYHSISFHIILYLPYNNDMGMIYKNDTEMIYPPGNEWYKNEMKWNCPPYQRMKLPWQRMKSISLFPWQDANRCAGICLAHMIWSGGYYWRVSVLYLIKLVFLFVNANFLVLSSYIHITRISSSRERWKNQVKKLSGKTQWNEEGYPRLDRIYFCSREWLFFCTFIN